MHGKRVHSGLQAYPSLRYISYSSLTGKPDRNAIGAYGGPYSIYRSLAVAMGDLPADVSHLLLQVVTP